MRFKNTGFKNPSQVKWPSLINLGRNFFRYLADHKTAKLCPTKITLVRVQMAAFTWST
ncbi:hypothetical protein QFZ20_001564 [Flavobacterium sp. W4I14]|nr:hypothetical protein [Flavobacterium sp. W4I14]